MTFAYRFENLQLYYIIFYNFIDPFLKLSTAYTLFEFNNIFRALVRKTFTVLNCRTLQDYFDVLLLVRCWKEKKTWNYFLNQQCHTTKLPTVWNVKITTSSESRLSKQKPNTLFRNNRYLADVRMQLKA